MSFTTLATHETRATRQDSSVVAKFLSGYLAMQRRRQQRRKINELNSLSDHELKDIGFHRSEVTSLVASNASRERHRHARN